MPWSVSTGQANNDPHHPARRADDHGPRRWPGRPGSPRLGAWRDDPCDAELCTAPRSTDHRLHHLPRLIGHSRGLNSATVVLLTQAPQGARRQDSTPFSGCLHRSDGAEPYPSRAHTHRYLSSVLVTRAADCTTASRHAARMRAGSSTLTCGGEPASTCDKHDNKELSMHPPSRSAVIDADPPIPFTHEEIGSAAHEKHMPSVRA